MTTSLQFICVTTDDREQRLWVVAGAPEAAISSVLDRIPEGWTARLLDDVSAEQRLAIPDLKPGEVREIA